MKASREDLVIYCSCLEEVKRRLKVVRSITQAEFSTDNVEMDAEIACLQLRKALELIAFASLSANHSLYTRVHGDISSAWSAKRILNKLEKLHPDFYPRPILFEGESEGGVKHFANVKSGYLTRAEFVVLYDKCSSVVHAWNPRKLGVRRVDFGHARRSVGGKDRNIARRALPHRPGRRLGLRSILGLSSRREGTCIYRHRRPVGTMWSRLAALRQALFANCDL